MSAERQSLRCRWGFHAWRFVSMSDRRMVTVAPHTFWICRLVERCQRCHLKRTSPNALPRSERL